MPKEYYSAGELAGLPGMPRSPRGVNIRATSLKWKFQPRRAVGGGREYHVSNLPTETRVALGVLTVPDIVDQARDLVRQLDDLLALTEWAQK